MKSNKTFVPKGLTKKERKAYILRNKQEQEYKRRFDEDLRFCFDMETSRNFRNAWKATTYLACKERN